MPSGDIYRISVLYKAGDHEAATTHHYFISTPGGPDDTFAKWLNGFRLKNIAALRQILPTTATVHKMTLAKEPLRLIIRASLDVELAGTFPETKYFPPQVATLISQLRQIPFGRKTGRYYLPFRVMTGTAAAETDYRFKLSALDTSLRGFIHPDNFSPSGFGTAVVYHRATNTTTEVAIIPGQITHFRTQRRRADKPYIWPF